MLPGRPSLLSRVREGRDFFLDQRLLLLGAVLVTGIILATWGDNRRELTRLRGESTRLSSQVEELTGRLAEANRELVALSSNPFALEKEARERLLMGRPGEYLIPIQPAR